MDKNKKSKMKSGQGFTVGESGGFSLSLGALLGKTSSEEAKAAKAQEPPKTPKGAKEEKGEKGEKKCGEMKLTKVSLQHRTSGCGGKTVTVVTLPQDTAVNKEELARELRRGLGCGSRVEEGKIILQGDICDRAAEWFSKKGAAKIVKG